MINKGKRWVAMALTVLALGVTLSGCWDDQSIDTRTLVLGMGFYPGKNPNTLEVEFSFPTPTGLTSSNGSGSGGGGGSGPSVSTLTGYGQTLSQAFSMAQAKTSRDLYLGHTVFLVFSTKLTAAQMQQISQALNRIGTLDKTPFMAATAEPWDKIMDIKMAQEKFPALYYEELFSCATCQQFSLGVRLWQMSERLGTPGVDLALPLVSSTPEGPAVDQIAVYHGYHYAGTFNRQQTTAYALDAGYSYKSPLYLPHYWKAEFNFVADKVSMHANARGDHVNATLNMHVTETLESIDTNTETAEQLSVLSRQSSRLIAHEAMQYVTTSQKLDTDLLGVGRYLSWTNPAAFNRLGDWHREYPRVHFTIHCTVRINKMGDIH